MRGLKAVFLGLALLGSMGHMSGVLAALVTLDLTYESDSPGDLGGLTGTGYVTFDDSLLVTGSGGFVRPTNLADFSLTVFGTSIPGGSTSFVLGDLEEWLLRVDGSGTVAGITEMTFSMDGAVNGDGFGLDLAPASYLYVYDGLEDAGEFMRLADISARGSVPEPLSALLLGGGLIALGWLRRRVRTI